MTAETAQAAPPPGRVMVKRHGLLVRLNHWINVIALVLLLGSGLQIFNAHAALYWGKASNFDDPWFSMYAQRSPDGVHMKGFTTLGSAKLETTGVFGSSKLKGKWQDQGFPGWMTVPGGEFDLTNGRHWHLFFAWVFAVNGLVYLITGLIGWRLPREVIPTSRDLKTALKDPHLRLKFSKGPEAAHYHQMQKIAYTGVVFLLLPTIALTGMTMSPGLNAAFPFLLDLFGGRQSARSIHFICANLIVAFLIVHLLAVILSGPINQVRAMITGKLAIIPSGDEEVRP